MDPRFISMRKTNETVSKKTSVNYLHFSNNMLQAFNFPLNHCGVFKSGVKYFKQNTSHQFETVKLDKIYMLKDDNSETDIKPIKVSQSKT